MTRKVRSNKERSFLGAILGQLITALMTYGLDVSVKETKVLINSFRIVVNYSTGVVMVCCDRVQVIIPKNICQSTRSSKVTPRAYTLTPGVGWGVKTSGI